MRIGVDACLEGRELKSRAVVAAMRRTTSQPRRS
jgi:hypothetical protein